MRHVVIIAIKGSNMLRFMIVSLGWGAVVFKTGVHMSDT